MVADQYQAFAYIHIHLQNICAHRNECHLVVQQCNLDGLMLLLLIRKK